MRFLKKYIWIIFGLGIFTLFFLTRFYNILGLPIFTDEAIYLRWAQIAGNDAAWRFISLTDGKQPMFVWIGMILMKFIEDPLLAGRLVSVLAGIGSMIGLFFLTSEIFKNKKIGILVSLLYVLYPFALVYDRMALYDSLVSMFIIWSLYFEVLVVRYIRLDFALILGMIIGLGMLTKTNANFAFILLPFLLLLFNFKDKKWKEKLGKLVLFSVVAFVIANAMYLILRLSPYFHIIEAKNYVFIYPLSEWLTHPFTYFIGNFRALSDWTVQYSTIPFFILIIASFFVGREYFREKVLLLMWFAVPFIAFAFFGRVIYPRHVLFTTMPLLILAGYALYYLFVFTKKSWLRVLVPIVFILPMAISDYLIVTDFANAPVPKSDKGQFLAAWPSGIGVRETVAFLKEQSKNQKIYVGTEGTFGLMPYSLELYLVDNPNIKIQAFWPINDQIPVEVKESAKKMPTYFVFYQPCVPCQNEDLAPSQWPVSTIFSIDRTEKDSHYTLYKIENK